MASSGNNTTGHSLGVLYTGWLDKKNPVSGYYKKRFVVLTSEAIHWFKRETKSEKTDLFGEERGQISLSQVLSVRILDEDSNVLAIQSTDRKTRHFKGENNTDVEEWVSAIRSAGHNSKKLLSGKDKNITLLYHDDLDGDKVPEVMVQIISVKSRSKQIEYVASRSPLWDRIISITDFLKDDEIFISMSNGGIVSLNYSLLETRSDQKMSEFDVPIQAVAIPQSLRMTISKDEAESGPVTARSSGWVGRPLSRCLESKAASMVIMLALMVLAVSGHSVATLTADNAMLAALSICLSIVSISLVVTPTSKEVIVETGFAYTLCIRGHQYTSPDEPVHVMDEDIPQRFINGSDGDVKEARRRWDVTRYWREQEGVNNVLQEPQPHFFIIRSLFPHYHAGRGKDGHVVWFERAGELDLPQIKARGVTLDALFRHWLFVTEYQWKILSPDEESKSITVLDVEKVKFSDVGGELMDHTRRTIATANQHYPERSHVIFVVNAPSWSSFVWRLLSPFVHPNTQKKVKILSKKETLAGLQEHLDISQIPEYYGGQLDFGGPDSCRFKSPESLAMDAYVRDINNKAYGGSPDDNSSVPSGKRVSLNVSSSNLDSTSTSLERVREDDVWSVCSGKTATTVKHR